MASIRLAKGKAQGGTWRKKLNGSHGEHCLLACFLCASTFLVMASPTVGGLLPRGMKCSSLTPGRKKIAPNLNPTLSPLPSELPKECQTGTKAFHYLCLQEGFPCSKDCSTRAQPGEDLPATSAAVVHNCPLFIADSN